MHTDAITNDPGTNDPGTPDSGGRRTRAAAIGVTAGLLAGGAIGLVMTMPSLTSAATGDAVAVTARADDTVDDTVDAGLGATTDERPEPGTRLRELLQPLVDDGTISAEQADSVAGYLAEQAPDREGRRPGRFHRGPAFDGEVIAGLIGIDVETLRTELAAGSSIADVAEANGVDPDTIVEALVAELSAHLDLMVEDGRLTDDEADEMLAKGAERIGDLVDRSRPTRG